MGEMFFSLNSTAPPPSVDTGMTVLSGPPRCGKTSLLFQFTINRATESGQGVLFICSKSGLESNPPFLSQGVDPSLIVLQRVQIKYIEDNEGIKEYFAAFDLLENFPAAVIVDDFTGFFSDRSCQQRYGTSRARDLAMVRILALCQNAIAHANPKNANNHLVRVYARFDFYTAGCHWNENYRGRKERAPPLVKLLSSRLVSATSLKAVETFYSSR